MVSAGIINLHCTLLARCSFALTKGSRRRTRIRLQLPIIRRCVLPSAAQALLLECSRTQQVQPPACKHAAVLMNSHQLGKPQHALAPAMCGKHELPLLCGQVDTWAVGILAAELITGSPPFEAQSRSTTYQMIMYRQPQLPGWLSPAAKAFIAAALEKVETLLQLSMCEPASWYMVGACQVHCASCNMLLMSGDTSFSSKHSSKRSSKHSRCCTGCGVC